MGNNRLKQLESWDVNQNPMADVISGLGGSRRKRTKRKTYTFTEYDEQIDLALGITPPTAKKPKAMSERKQKKINHTNFRSLRLRGQSPANFMLDESSMSSISSTDTNATSV